MRISDCCPLVPLTRMFGAARRVFADRLGLTTVRLWQSPQQGNRRPRWRPYLEEYESRVVPSTLVWQTPWEVTLVESGNEYGIARTAFGASATSDGEIANTDQPSAAARVFAQSAGGAGWDEAEAEVRFWRTFELTGSPNGAQVTLQGLLDGTLTINLEGRTGDEYLEAVVEVLARAWIIEGTPAAAGSVTHELSFQKLYQQGYSTEDVLIEDVISHSEQSVQVLADGTYTVQGFLKGRSSVAEGVRHATVTASSAFFDPPGWVVSVDAVPWQGDSPPSVAISDVSITEGNSGTTAASFTVTLSAPSTQTVIVEYATANSTATAGTDYQAASGTLTFAPGEASKTVTVLVTGDRVGEPSETFVVNLTGATNATIADEQGVGTILDDEPRMAIRDASVKEGNGGKTLMTFTVTLSFAYDAPVTVNFATQDGTAKTSGKDYVAASGTLTFAAGETSKTITIEVVGDRKKESDEYFFVNLFGAEGALLIDAQGVGTILNDDK